MLEYILHNASKDIIHKYGILRYYTQVWYLKILYTSIANIYIVRANTDLIRPEAIMPA